MDTVGRHRLEAACARALYFGDPRYRRIRDILGAGLEQEPLPGDASPQASLPVPTQTRQFAFARSASEFFGVEGDER